MSDHGPERDAPRPPVAGAGGPGRSAVAARLRQRVRDAADRLLGAEVAWSGLLVAVCLLLLGTQRCGRDGAALVVGQHAPFDIRASYDVDVVDEALSEERRREARERVPDVYVHDAERWMQLARELGAVFRDGRAALEDATLRGAADARAAARRRLEGRVPEPALAVLVTHEFDAALERTLTATLTQTLDRLVIGNKSLLEREPAIVLLHVPGRHAARLERYDDIVDVALARREVEERLAARLGLPADEAAALTAFAGSFVDANVHLDSEATQARREAAAAEVPPVVQRVARGEVLIREGDTITAEAAERLAAALRQSGGRLGVGEFLGWGFVLGILAFCALRYCRQHQRFLRKVRQLNALFVGVLVSMLLLSAGLLWVARRVVEDLPPPYGDPGTYAYLVPLGAGAILVALLANGRVATVYSAFAALLFAAVTGGDLYLALWATIVQLSAIYAVSAYRERAALLRAGLVVGVTGALAVLALETLAGTQQPGATAFYGAGLALVGGAIGVGLVVSFALPPLEWLFNALTDVRLLELSHANHPLLSQFAVKAPGSYNHSLVVGTLAEEAARAIGANPLFCRVAAFYHDIGKMIHPEYYVENQHGTNPHDRLAPSMSALILVAHVKDGVRMAREAGLPRQIVDIIPQHHGTRRMTYFLEKARRAGGGSVREEDYRYPGPKPQTREAAIFMIADAVEAAARTVEEPTAARLREMIRRVTSSIVLDEQLDECDLTFADLERIQDAVLRLLVSMYHHRVDYPGFEFGRSRPGGESRLRPVARGS